MNLRDIAITSSLALSGVALWSFGASRLAAGGEFDFHPNPLGLKMSPYGQVIAIAMQGGVESDWHGTQAKDGSHTCSDCGHHHAENAAACEEPKDLIARMEKAATERTNPRPPTRGHKFYLRRQAEERLRLAYELDPSNYANYNSYHLFLTEPMVGTKPILTDRVIALARETITYCLRDESDPRPALTAASAAGNILELMFQHPGSHTVEQMQGQLQLMDFTLGKHHDLTEAWLESGNFERISVARQQEMLERQRFVLKVRDAADQTVRRLSASGRDQASHAN